MKQRSETSHAMESDVLNRLSAVEIEQPSDIILRQIKALIDEGTLRPGDRLPSERSLAERFNVGRTPVREALRRLEFYGIVRTRPQSGTTVENIAPKGLAGLISNVISLTEPTLNSTIEARRLIEVEATRLAGLRADPVSLVAVRDAQRAHAEAAARGEPAVEEDVLFHLAIARICGNEILHSLTSVLAPGISQLAHDRGSCLEGRALNAAEEHAAVLRALERGDADAAAHAMHRHLTMTQARFDTAAASQPGADNRDGARHV
ncbi:MAG: GntR family transcriptional regulator [Rhizobiaceae bacterium]|nr:GntR family transcriptional regulator [Rhizobiaceae bacterium]